MKNNIEILFFKYLIFNLIKKLEKSKDSTVLTSLEKLKLKIPY